MKSSLEIISLCSFSESDANESMPEATTYINSEMLSRIVQSKTIQLKIRVTVVQQQLIIKMEIK